MPTLDCHGQRHDHEGGLHPGVDGVAHDPVGAAVLDRAQVEPALGGAVLGDAVSHNRFCASAVNRRCTWSSWIAGRGLARARTLADHRGHTVLVAEPPDPVLAGVDHARVSGQLVGDEPVAEFRVVAVDVEDGVDQVRVVPVPVADRVGVPCVEGLCRENPSTRQVTVTAPPGRDGPSRDACLKRPVSRWAQSSRRASRRRAFSMNARVPSSRRTVRDTRAQSRTSRLIPETSPAGRGVYGS